MRLMRSMKTEKELDAIFNNGHKKGETCRITISLFMKHYALKPLQDEIAQKIAEVLSNSGFKHLDDFMVTMSPIISEEEIGNIPNAQPKDVRGMKLKWT